jgi:hypothetical protein
MRPYIRCSSIRSVIKRLSVFFGIERYTSLMTEVLILTIKIRAYCVKFYNVASIGN